MSDIYLTLWPGQNFTSFFPNPIIPNVYEPGGYGVPNDQLTVTLTLGAPGDTLVAGALDDYTATCAKTVPYGGSSAFQILANQGATIDGVFTVSVTLDLVNTTHYYLADGGTATTVVGGTATQTYHVTVIAVPPAPAYTTENLVKWAYGQAQYLGYDPAKNPASFLQEVAALLSAKRPADDSDTVVRDAEYYALGEWAGEVGGLPGALAATGVAGARNLLKFAAQTVDAVSRSIHPTHLASIFQYDPNIPPSPAGGTLAAFKGGLVGWLGFWGSDVTNAAAAPQFPQKSSSSSPSNVPSSSALADFGASDAAAIPTLSNLYERSAATGTTDVFADNNDYQITFGPTPPQDGNSIIFDTLANTPLIVGSGNHFMIVAVDNQTVSAGNGSNTIILQGGANTVSVGTGENFVIGGSGNDAIAFGGGVDIIAGSAGSDKFVLNSAVLSAAQGAAPPLSIIVDYDQGNLGHYSSAEADQIELSAFLSAAFNHGSGLPVSSLVRALESSDQSYAVLQVENGSPGQWLTIAQLNGLAIGQTVNVILDPSMPTGSNIQVVSTADPAVASITRSDPAVTNPGTVHYVISFSEPVTGVALADFGLNTSGIVGASLSSVEAVAGSNNEQYTVAVNTGTGTGTLTLTVNAGSIHDFADRPLPGGTFLPQQLVATGSQPISLAVGDLNGDGNSDVVVANFASNNVSVLMGKGDGTFQPQTTYATDTGPEFVAIGDLNGDGKPDLIVDNASSNTISVLLNNGGGSFHASASYAAGPNAISLAVADLNGDGKLDVIVADGSSNSVSILLGNGNGTLQPQTIHALEGNPSSVATADLNGDGKLDLIVATPGSSANTSTTISVLLGGGDGTFQAPMAFAAGTSPISVAVGDVNGDGNLDIVAANLGSNTSSPSSVSVLLGNGDGTFQTPTNYGVAINPISVTFGDLNGDGNLDIIVANSSLGTTVNSSTLSVLFGLGDGTFQSQTGYNVGVNPFSVGFGDFNGDGRPDIIATNGQLGSASSSNASVLLNTAPSFVGPTYTIQTVPPPTVSSLTATTDTGLTHVNGGHLAFVTMTTSAAVTVAGTPTLQLNDNEVAYYTGGSGTNTLSFAYVVNPLDNVPDLQVSGLNLPSGASILDGNGNSLAGPVIGDLGLSIAGKLTPATVAQEIHGLYLTLYGIAATQPGIVFWENVLHDFDGSVTTANAASTAVSLNDQTYLGEQMTAGSPIVNNTTYFATLYPTSMSDMDYVKALYQNMSNFIGTVAGDNYWLAVLQQAEATNGGDVIGSRESIAGQFVHDFLSNDLTIGAATLNVTPSDYTLLVNGQQALLNRALISQDYANETVAPGGSIINFTTVTSPAFAAAHNVVAAVTSDPASVAVAITGINNAIAQQDLSLI